MYSVYFGFDVFILHGLYMLGGDIMLYVYVLLLFLVSQCTLIIDLYYEVIHGICLLFYVL